MPKIGIVTDSTSDMPLSFYEENDVTMVPLAVRFGEEVYQDWIEMPPRKFYTMLTGTDILPKTSQPSVQQFIDVYNKFEGYDHVISVHISSKLSGTIQSAEIASQNVNVPITVIDSKLTSAGLGFIVLELVSARNEGKDISELLRLVDELTGKVRLLFCVDTLKYLELGGRIGKASALLGSILNIKPILSLEDGIVVPHKKVKGRKRLFKEIVETLKEASGGPLKIGVYHGNAPESAAELLDHIKAEAIEHELVLTAEIGSVVGTYTGPGTFGIAFYPSE